MDTLMDEMLKHTGFEIYSGNGNFSKRLVELGAIVTAFDCSNKMVENAKKRCSHCLDNIDFHLSLPSLP